LTASVYHATLRPYGPCNEVLCESDKTEIRKHITSVVYKRGCEPKTFTGLFFQNVPYFIRTRLCEVTASRLNTNRFGKVEWRLSPFTKIYYLPSQQ